MSQREASRPTLERLAEAADVVRPRLLGLGYEDVQAFLAACDSYRAETRPLRSRAEVDAEIATVVRERFAAGNITWVGDTLNALCREPTQDSGPSSEDAPPSASPAGADLSDPEACSCEESERLKDELKEAQQLLDFARRSAQDVVTILEEGRARSVDVGALEERVRKLEGNAGFRP